MELCDLQNIEACKPRVRQPHELRPVPKEGPNPDFFDNGTRVKRVVKETTHGRK